MSTSPDTDGTAPVTESAPRPVRLGYFSYLHGDQPQAEIYAQVLELFIVADELGFDVGWVAQAHLVGGHGGLPSPFVFFSTLAERTKRISLGTAVVTLPLEDPLRVAEDAAVFEALHPGRLELGLGTGFGDEKTSRAFGLLDPAQRRHVYDERVTTVITALRGEPVGADRVQINPSASTLTERIWEGPSTYERVLESASRGSGLLLSRVAIGAGERRSHVLQVPFVDGYLDAIARAGREPRVALSRTIYPATDRRTAANGLRTGVAHMADVLTKQGGPTGLDFEQAAAFMNIHYGSSEDIVESLRAEPTLPHITDLVCQLEPGVASFDETVTKLTVIATEIAPSLGWKPASEREPTYA